MLQCLSCHCHHRTGTELSYFASEASEGLKFSFQHQSLLHAFFLIFHSVELEYWHHHSRQRVFLRPQHTCQSCAQCLQDVFMRGRQVIRPSAERVLCSHPTQYSLCSCTVVGASYPRRMFFLPWRMFSASARGFITSTNLCSKLNSLG